VANVRRWFSSVRGRSTLQAMVAVAVAMAVGSLLLLWAFRGQLESNLAASLQTEADARVARLESGAAPADLIASTQEEAMVWIGTPAGETVAVGGGIQPVENPVPTVIGTAVTKELKFLETDHGAGEEVEQHELLLTSAVTSDGGLVVVTGAETETINKSIAGLAKLMLFAIPGMTALVGLLAWVTVGRTLEPVELIRTQALSISGQSLGERVPVPTNSDEISSLAIGMNEMLDRLEAHEHSGRQFTADASHELKSPVANVRAMVDTASIDDPAWPQLQRQLANETDRLRDLVDNLLFLASANAGQSSEQRSVDLDELLFAEAEILSATGKVVVDLGGVEPAVIKGSPRDIARLVRNLVDNAARHARTRVLLSVHSTGGGVELIVGDDGVGVPVEDRQRVFERFTRLDHARAREDGGSGLGLSIVRSVADAHNATVTVGESPLGGAEFGVHFPQR
jgi:signal transduction histidine kinase